MHPSCVLNFKFIKVYNVFQMEYNIKPIKFKPKNTFYNGENYLIVGSLYINRQILFEI